MSNYEWQFYGQHFRCDAATADLEDGGERRHTLYALYSAETEFWYGVFVVETFAPDEMLVSNGLLASEDYKHDGIVATTLDDCKTKLTQAFEEYMLFEEKP